MKVVTASDGKKTVKITKKEWEMIGLKFEEARKKSGRGYGKGDGTGPMRKNKIDRKTKGKGKADGTGPFRDGTGPRAKEGKCPKVKK